MRRTRMDVEEVDERLHKEYDNRLQDALRQMRAENDEQIQQSRAEVETIYQQKVSINIHMCCLAHSFLFMSIRPSRSVAYDVR